MRKLTTEEFIEKSIEIWGNRFDYSLVEYENNKKKVKIICPKHGEFEQRASAHSTGQGCPECKFEKRRTGLGEFLIRCEEVHGDKFDYSLVTEYKNHNTKVKVICKKHGEFLISSKKHLIGQGCSECKKLGLDGFIEKAKEKWGDRYDYSLIKYKNNKEKVNIICKKHGVFKQRVTDHFNTEHGCPECALSEVRVSINDFIKRSNNIHNNKYDYSKVEFKTNKDYIIITCSKHGEFRQKMESHMNKGQGCPICKESRGEKEIRKYLIDEKIKFKSQKKFDDCIYKDKLIFDFYLPDSNTSIEYNGKQHYEPNDYFGGEEAFKKQLIRDNIKKEYCENNNIKLIIIRYDEDINKKLTQYLR